METRDESVNGTADEAYEPPRLEVLGTFEELTTGPLGGAGDALENHTISG